MDTILTMYPLSSTFKERMAYLVRPDATQVSLTELRQLPLVKMVQKLRSLKCKRVLVPLEDESSAGLLPLLKSMAIVIPAESYLYLDHDLKAVQFSRLDVSTSTGHMVMATTSSQLAVRRARQEIAALAALPRIAVGTSSSKRLVFLNANLWFGVKAGGSVGHVSGVVNGFLECGHEVDYVSVGGRLLVKDAAHYVPIEPPKYMALPWEANYYKFHFSAAQQTEAICRQHRPALIYQRLSIANYTGAAVSRRLGLPLIIEYNGSEAWVARNWGKPLRYQALAEQAEEVCLAHAHLIVTISDVLRDELIGRGIPAERIVTYPNCIDPETFDPARFTAAEIVEVRKRHGIAEDALVITFVGTFGQWHGAPVLAAAARELLDNEADWVAANRIHFLFVGDGDKMPEVRKALGPHVSGPNVTLAGLVPQKMAPLYLAASDILSSPHVENADGSQFFGSPTKLFEYMAMGKPIIASDLNQIGEVLTGSIRSVSPPSGSPSLASSPPAMLTAPGSSQEIATGIRFLVERPDWRHALGTNARRLALEKYTWRHHVLAIIQGAQKVGLLGPD